MRSLMVAFVALALSVGPGSALAAGDDTPAAGTFLLTGPLAEARSGHTATLLPDGRVLVVGGLGASDDESGGYAPARSLASAEVWDPATEGFTPTGTLTEARAGHTASLLPDGRVLVVGGEGGADASEVLGTAEVWDPVSGRFEPTGSLAEARRAHAATPLSDGRVLIVGGEGGWDDAIGSQSRVILAEVWDVATGRFTEAGAPEKQRSYHTATLLPDGRVVVIGGIDPSALSTLRKRVEVWDPMTSSFTGAGKMDEPRWWHTATRLADGRVAIMGGYGENDFPTEVLVWDPETTEFTPVGELAEPRLQHTATLLPDVRVLVVGGGEMTMGAAMAGSAYLLATAEVWDPAAGVSSPTGPLAGMRGMHTATVLPDGRVLIVGGLGVGDDGDGGSLASAEVWEPSGAPP